MRQWRCLLLLALVAAGPTEQQLRDAERAHAAEIAAEQEAAARGRRRRPSRNASSRRLASRPRRRCAMRRTRSKRPPRGSPT